MKELIKSKILLRLFRTLSKYIPVMKVSATMKTHATALEAICLYPGKISVKVSRVVKRNQAVAKTLIKSV